jgi:putative glutamine amidotransferase
MLADDDTEKRTPTILVSGQITLNPNTKALEASRSVKAAIEQLQAQGVDTQLVYHPGMLEPERFAELMKSADGIVFMGNDQDIDPASYGQTAHPKTQSELNETLFDHKIDGDIARARAQWEQRAMAHALDHGIPVLGICAGMQRMNVVGCAKRDGSGTRAGGTLHQHVAGAWQEISDMADPVKPISITPDSRLGAMLAATQSAPLPHNRYTSHVNSRHHQAIDTVAQGFRAIATCPTDGAQQHTPTIQAIELVHEHHYALGVQWHPELMPQHPLSQKIFESIASAARDRAGAKAVSAHGVSHIMAALQGRAAQRPSHNGATR